jgi:glycosyltransferase involved in cell wall biosynthesis
VVVQDGARLRYALPIALERLGVLERVVTDWYLGSSVATLLATSLLKKIRPNLALRLVGRRSSELTDSKVFSYPLLSLWLKKKRSRFPNSEAFHEWESRRAAKAILRQGFGKANVLVGFIRNMSPHLVAKASEQGLCTIGDQMIAPAATEMSELQRQQSAFPDWQSKESLEGASVTRQVEEQTWPILTAITCASDYVRNGLLSAGVPDDKISVNPYPVDATKYEAFDRTNRQGVVKVGFAGAISLRKGAPYFFKVARNFTSDKVDFVMAGYSWIPESILEKKKGRVELLGGIQREQIKNFLRDIDIFFFPSTCEGSATAVMEAMASGLPIVTTPNSGSVVRDGQEGFICDYDDISGLTERLKLLIDDPNRRRTMGLAARRRAEMFTIDAYAARLSGLLNKLS